MKKLIRYGLICSCAIAGLFVTHSTRADDNSVYSVNIVGFQQIELPPDGGSRLTSAPFNSGGNTLLDVFGTNSLRQSNFLVDCDKVTIYDPDTQTYQRWAQWIDGNFYKANTASEWSLGQAGNPEIPVGTGFWLTSAGTSSEPHPITLAGDVVTAATQLVALVEGFQIVGYPFSSDMDLANTPDLVASGASSSGFLIDADRITVYDPSTTSYQRYALWTDGNWYKANDASEWAAGVPADELILSGSAFWYEAKSAFEWLETNPYSGVLD